MNRDEKFDAIAKLESEHIDRLSRQVLGNALDVFDDHLGLKELAVEAMSLGIWIFVCEMFDLDEDQDLMDYTRDHVYAAIIDKALKKKEAEHE